MTRERKHNRSWSPDDSRLTQRLDRLLKRRRLAFALLIGAFLALLVSFNLIQFLFLRQISNQLEEELGRRLISIAKLISDIIETEYLDPFGSLPQDELRLIILRDRLLNLRRQHELEGLYLIDRKFNVLLDSSPFGKTPLPRSYLRADSSSIGKAWETGVPVTSPLHAVGNQHFKSAFAPIRNLQGQTVAVLVTEANAYFFLLLDRYRQTFYASVVASAGLFILFGGLLAYALRLLMQSQERLLQSERLAMMGQMAAVLAHEIRNPLGIIRGTADILRSRYNPAEKPDPLFEYIPDEINRLNKLVSDFLFLSREHPLQKTRGNLNQLIETVISRLKTDPSFHEIDFHLELAGELPDFDFDPSGIEQVLMNLIKNGCQAMDGEGRLDIRTSLKNTRKGLWAEVTVRDYGKGIEGDPEQVFAPFYTTKSTGSGLGMAISKKIVEQHGGTIKIESSPGKGTAVVFRLPVQEE